MTKALVLLSGGMDSTTCLAQALSEGHDEVQAITFHYGSHHQTAETNAAREVIYHYNVLQHNIIIPNIWSGAKLALMGDAEIPKGEYIPDGTQPTVIPFRNAVLLSLAVAHAATQGFDFVYSGQHAGDWGGWAYPDCSPEFLGPFIAAVFAGTNRQVRLRTPFQWIPKAGIVALGHKLGVPFELTWSCYDPAIRHASSPTIVVYQHCGECGTCRERKAAFEAAQVKDPTEYVK